MCELGSHAGGSLSKHGERVYPNQTTYVTGTETAVVRKEGNVLIQRHRVWGFPGGPMVRALLSLPADLCSISDQGTKIPQVSGIGYKNTEVSHHSNYHT